MEKKEKAKRKSHNRIEKEQRDFETLFNAKIDVEARERRQQRLQKRKQGKSNAVVATMIKASRFDFSKSEKTTEKAEKTRRLKTYPLSSEKEEAASLSIAKPDLSEKPVLTDVSAPRVVSSAPAAKEAKKKREPFFAKSAQMVSKLYAELTDKALIEKLREDPQDSCDVFAEIKESLEKTPIDAMIVQNWHDNADTDKKPQIQLKTTEQVQDTTTGEEDTAPTAVIPAPKEGQTGEEDDQALVPEVIEAMKEIDYEHIMCILEPKLAFVVDRTDQLLDRTSKKFEYQTSLLSTKVHILTEKIFCGKNENPIVAVRATQKVRAVIFAGFRKVTLPCAGFARNSAYAVIRITGKGRAAISGHLRKCILLLAKINKKHCDTWKASRFYAVYTNQFRKEKNHSIVAVSGILVVSVFFGTAAYLERISAFEVFFLDSPIGIVKEKNDVLDVLPVIEENLEKETGADIYINASEDFTFKPVRSRNLKILTGEQIQSKLEDINTINVSAYALKINGNTIAVMTERAQVEGVLAAVEDDYMADKNASDFDSVKFSEKVEIVPMQAKMMQISDPEEVKKYLLMGTTEEKVHVVAEGETLSGIAQQYGIKTSEVSAANPEIDPTKLQINQEISLIAPKPFITVETKETRTYVAEIPFEIIYEESQSLFKGETTVKSTGKPGEKQITAEITKQNGVEVARVEIESTVLADPVNQVVVKGSKALPLLLGTGKFQNPVRGTLSSRYGQRWSRMHQGIDIAAAKGTSISAADGGTVIYAGYDGAYGNTVRINHGGNKVTVYAHCSKILVKKGQKVAKGQQIATVGNTGRTTGYHLHFEVRVGGKIVNPLDGYVKY